MAWPKRAAQGAPPLSGGTKSPSVRGPKQPGALRAGGLGAFDTKGMPNAAQQQDRSFLQRRLPRVSRQGFRGRMGR